MLKRITKLVVAMLLLVTMAGCLNTSRVPRDPGGITTNPGGTGIAVKVDRSGMVPARTMMVASSFSLMSEDEETDNTEGPNLCLMSSVEPNKLPGHDVRCISIVFRKPKQTAMVSSHRPVTELNEEVVVAQARVPIGLDYEVAAVEWVWSEITPGNVVREVLGLGIVKGVMVLSGETTTVEVAMQPVWSTMDYTPVVRSGEEKFLGSMTVGPNFEYGGHGVWQMDGGNYLPQFGPYADSFGPVRADFGGDVGIVQQERRIDFRVVIEIFNVASSDHTIAVVIEPSIYRNEPPASVLITPPSGQIEI